MAPQTKVPTPDPPQILMSRCFDVGTREIVMSGSDAVTRESRGIY